MFKHEIRQGTWSTSGGVVLGGHKFRVRVMCMRNGGKKLKYVHCMGVAARKGSTSFMADNKQSIRDKNRNTQARNAKYNRSTNAHKLSV